MLSDITLLVYCFRINKLRHSKNNKWALLGDITLIKPERPSWNYLLLIGVKSTSFQKKIKTLSSVLWEKIFNHQFFSNIYSKKIIFIFELCTKLLSHHLLTKKKMKIIIFEHTMRQQLFSFEVHYQKRQSSSVDTNA